MRIEPTDVVVREVDVWKFVKEIEHLVNNGYKVKSYELSVYSPAFDGVGFHTVMEKRQEDEFVAEKAANVAEQAPEEKPTRRAPPIRQSKKQAE